MRKQELIHIHSLLVVTRRHLSDQEDIEIPAGAFDGYDNYGVRPTAIAERKDAHKEAVDQLVEGLQTTFTTYRTITDSPSASLESIDTQSSQSS